jgi:penicillin-insensitive murein DD-endopeptidase
MPAKDLEPGSASPPEPDVTTLGPEASTSVGSPGEGHLEGSVALPLRGPGWRFNPRKDPSRRHGTIELVRALVVAARRVHDTAPGGELVISDISLPEGGEIGGHASHRAGRDVDVFFYLVDEQGRPFEGKAIPLEPDGTGHDYGDLTTAEDDVKVQMDVPRTWAFVEALVGQEDARINRIFVVEHLRTLLLEHAETIGAPAEIRTRFGHLTCQPEFPHDDHFHIRFYCSPDDIEAGCEDTKPLYPWHLAHLREAGVKVQLAGPRKTGRPKLTSVDDAAKHKRQELGALHADVEAFLARRKAWAKKPRPGRTYCR